MAFSKSELLVNIFKKLSEGVSDCQTVTGINATEDELVNMQININRQEVLHGAKVILENELNLTQVLGAVH